MDVHANGVRFNCVVEGPEGAPWVTLAHALANNLTLWDEIAAESETKAKIVEIFRKYNSDMQKAGRPYRYS